MPCWPAVPILMYHKVDRAPAGVRNRGHYVSPALFDRQLKLLSRLGFRSSRLDQLFVGPEPEHPRPIVLTFDDGYADFHAQALPVLERHGFRGTVFLVSSQIGGTNAWDVREGEVEERLLDEAAIRDCAARGTEFGSHTAHHADLRLSADLEREVAGSKADLEALLGAPVNAFCYPYGRHRPEAVEAVRRAGYTHATGTGKGFNTLATDRHLLKRVNVRRDTTATLLLFKLLRDRKRG